MSSDLLKNRLDNIKERISAATVRSGRSVGAVEFVAVTKTVDVDRINEALRLGIKVLGENRVQEAAAKRPELRGTFEFHLLGPLQTNKAKTAVELFDVIESVDRLKVAEKLDRLAHEQGKKQRCLLEVKISDEPSKSGVALQDVADFLAAAKKHNNIVFEGLMGIGALGVSSTETRQAFKSLKEVFEKHRAHFGERPVLSMGMSDDFEMAIEEGSTCVRIGRALFGERK